MSTRQGLFNFGHFLCQTLPHLFTNTVAQVINIFSGGNLLLRHCSLVCFAVARDCTLVNPKVLSLGAYICNW
jgi:hypothetical protein